MTTNTLNMRKLAVVFFILLFNLFSQALKAQHNPELVKNLKEEQQRFVKNLKSLSNDSAIVNPIGRYFESEFTSIYRSFATDAKLPDSTKDKAVRSMVYFIKELRESLFKQRSDMYDITGALQSYRAVLTAILQKRPVDQLLVPLGPKRSQLMAAAFSQFKEYTLMDDVAVFKRVASSPDFILGFLENKPGFRYADSLVVIAAAHDPLKLVHYLKRTTPGVQDRIRSNRNIYLQQIVSLSSDKSASELVPFVTQIADGSMNTADILEKRTNVSSYFQLLVNTMIASKGSKDSSSIFLKPLRDGILQKSLAFFVNPINDLHSAADAVRFASVKNLRPQDIYYIMVTAGEDLYTSSYLGLYKRLMEHFRNQNADSLFSLVHYDNYRVFLRMAANYNVLANFLTRMPRDKMTSLMQEFIAGIASDTETGLENAMDIADSFAALDSAVEIAALVQHELRSNLTRSTANKQYLGIRLYSILLQVFELIKDDGALNKLWAKLGNYEVLKRDALENSQGAIDQLVLFYGDEDGVSSFNNFLKLYNDPNRWKVAKNNNWVSISSVIGPTLSIFANLPLDSKNELDLRAQDSLIAYLEQQSLQPSILIHRGHSYHLDKTLKRLQPSVKLAILGSCGGYNKAISIASINPDVQVIGSKKTGSKSINDPIIDVINETLLDRKDLFWPEIWSKLKTRFSKDEMTLNLFNEYFPPSDNLSLFVLKLFNYYNRFV